MSVRVLIVDDQEPFREAAWMVVEILAGASTIADANGVACEPVGARQVRGREEPVEVVRVPTDEGERER